MVALADAFGAERFHLVGHDWGAVIGWSVAAKHADRLSRVVLMDGPHPDVWGKQALTHPTQALRSTYVAFFQLPWMPEATLGAFDHAGLKAMMQGSAKPDTFEPGELDRYTEAWARPGSLTAMLNYYRALRRRPQSSEPARLTPPTLILWAEDDRFLEKHVAERGWSCATTAGSRWWKARATGLISSNRSGSTPALPTFWGAVVTRKRPFSTVPSLPETGHSFRLRTH